MSERAPSILFRLLDREKGLFLLVVLGVLYFCRPLFFNETFFFRDLTEHFLAQRRLLADSITSGELPLWDPFRQGGRPFLGNPNNVVLYPSSLLYLILPLLTAFNIDIVFHFIFASVAAYVCARVLGYRSSTSALCGVVYGYCGYALSLGSFLSRLYAAPYLPLMFACWHIFLRTTDRRLFLLIALLGTVQLFSGAPEMLMLTVPILAVWGLINGFSKRRQVLSWSLLLVLLVLVFGAIQIVPAAEIVGRSYRGSGMGISEFGTYSLNPWRLPELVFPEFFGRWDTLAANDYWGRALENSPFPHPYFVTIYTGLVTLCLAIAGAFNRKDTIVTHKARIALLLLLLLSFLLSLGIYLPLFNAVYAIPVLRWFRYPIKFLGLGVLPLALLAASGAEVLFFSNGRESRRFIVLTAWAIAAFLIFFAGLFLLRMETIAGLARFLFSNATSPVEKGLIHCFLHATGIWILATLILQYHQLKSRAVHAWLHTGLIALDLLVAGVHANPTASRELLESTPPLVETTRSLLDNGKLYREEAKARFSLRAPSNDLIWEHRYNLEVLNFYFAGLYKIPVIFHRDKDQMSPRETVQLAQILDKLPWDRKKPVLSAAGVTVIITPDRFSIPGIRFVGEISNPSSIKLYLYRNETSLGRQWFVPGIVRPQSVRQYLLELTDPNYDARVSALAAGIAPQEAGACQQDVQVVHWSYNSSELTVNNGCRGMLVFTDPYDPGWHVSVDGKDATVLRADYAFTGVLLEKGKHQISKRYRPASVLAGAVVSAVALITAIPLLGRRKRRRPPA